MTLSLILTMKTTWHTFLARDVHASSDHTEQQVYGEKLEVEETASDLFDDDTESVATDYEEGSAAFSGEYLQGLGRRRQGILEKVGIRLQYCALAKIGLS